MKKIILLGIVCLFSCERFVKVEKPFIITYKYPNSTECIGQGMARYQYEDANGRTCLFCEFSSKYEIGDTIK